MKFSHKLMATAITTCFLTACADSPIERNQAKDDFKYLDSSLASQWQMPSDARAQYYRQYTIPKGNYRGEVGENVDIRPPLQVLELVPGVQVDHEQGVVTLWTVQESYADNMWSILQNELTRNNASVVKSSASEIDSQSFTWTIGDDEGKAKVDYHFSRSHFGRRYGIKIEITGLTDSLNMPSRDFLLDRYTVAMANLVTTQYDAQLRAEAQRKAELMSQNIAFSMGTDRSGLPIIIARTTFDIAWHRVPRLIEQFGFEVKDKSQSQGSMKVKYRPADKEIWDNFNITPLTIERGSYNLLFGDLGNRTSINLTDSDGGLLSEEQMKAFIPMLKAASEPRSAQ
jgi:outer membrane protein assembly factor BamC